MSRDYFTMTKEQALNIFAQLAAQFRATPEEHQVVKQAFAVLAADTKPTEPTAPAPKAK